MHQLALAAHVAVGAVALASFWLAALLRKGSPAHRLAGRVYLWMMAGILLTALPLVASFFLQGDPVAGLFFAYLMVLVGTNVVMGRRAIRLKADYSAFLGGCYAPLAWAQLAGGAAVVATGVCYGHTLLMAFGTLGIVRAVRMLQMRRQLQPAPGWWLRQHFMAMIGNGIATHIAFLGIGLMQLLPPDLAQRVLPLNLSWFLPLAVGIGTMVRLSARHQRRFGAPRHTPPAVAAQPQS